MNFNWGTGIALVYGTFALSMVGAVVASRRYDPGLVSKDYYNLDLNCQAHMEKKQNAANLSVAPAARYDAGTQSVIVEFPAGMTVSNGSIKLFRSALVGDDLTIELPPDSGNEFAIPAADLHQGRWHVELDWTADTKKYFYATSVLLPNV